MSKNIRRLLMLLIVSVTASICSIVSLNIDIIKEIKDIHIYKTTTFKPWCFSIKGEQKSQYGPTSSSCYKYNNECFSFHGIYYGVNLLSFKAYDLKKKHDMMLFINDSTKCWNCNKQKRKHMLAINAIVIDNNMTNGSPDLMYAPPAQIYKIFTKSEMRQYSANDISRMIMRNVQRSKDYRWMKYKANSDIIKYIEKSFFDYLSTYQNQKMLENNTYYLLTSCSFIKFRIYFNKDESEVVNYKKRTEFYY